MLAHDDRSRVIADEHRPLVTTKNLRVKATFLLDGVVAGTWTMRGQAQGRDAAPRAVRQADAKVVKALEPEGEALLRFAEPEAKDWGVGSPGASS